MPRLFVAVEMPETVRMELGLLAAGLPGARWTPRDQLHVTLRFLGDVDGGAFADVQEELASVTLPRFELQLQSVGHFPPRGRPDILWAGVAGSEPLAALHAAVERAVRAAGMPPEERKFHAHVTVARLRDAPPRRVADWLTAHGLFESSPFTVSEFTLHSSILSSKGAQHALEAAYPLGS